MRKEELIVDMNCYGPVYLNATAGGIDFKNVHRIKVKNINDKILENNLNF